MTASAPFTDTQRPSRALEGILSVEFGMLFFVVQDAIMKSLLDTHSVWFLIFVRSSLAVICLTPAVLILGGPHRLLTPLWPLHLARAVLFACGFAMFYTAFPFMGLAEVTTIFFSGPLITALLAALFLGERIGPHRGFALALGFLGVVIAMNPTGDTFQWIAILPFICAFTYAISQIIARQIGDRETSLTVGLHTLAYSGLVILPIGWVVNQVIVIGPEFDHLRFALAEDVLVDLPRLLMVGVMGMGGYILISRAYQVANASLVAPFDYTYLPIAAVLAYLIWDEVPQVNTIVGMAMIVLGGLYLAYREIRAMRRTGDTPVVAETVFAPGNPAPAPAEAEPGQPLPR